MPETGPPERTDQTDWIGKALHDLSQPLTALECGLYVGTMSPDGVREPTSEELMRTILDALAQAERATLLVRAMQQRLSEFNVNEMGTQ